MPKETLDDVLHSDVPIPIHSFEANMWINGKLKPALVEISDDTIVNVSLLDKIIDSPFIVLPGIVDNHIHARESANINDVHDTRSLAKEDAYTVSLAALQGGTTSVVAMPNI